jgi:hypothetical protein
MADFDTQLVLAIWDAVEKRLGSVSPSTQEIKKKRNSNSDKNFTFQYLASDHSVA